MSRVIIFTPSTVNFYWTTNKFTHVFPVLLPAPVDSQFRLWLWQDSSLSITREKHRCTFSGDLEARFFPIFITLSQYLTTDSKSPLIHCWNFCDCCDQYLFITFFWNVTSHPFSWLSVGKYGTLSDGSWINYMVFAFLDLFVTYLNKADRT